MWDQRHAAWSLYIQHMHRSWHPSNGTMWMRLITYGIILSFGRETNKAVAKKTNLSASIWTYIHRFTSINLSFQMHLWNISCCLYLSLYSLHTHIYIYIYIFIFCTISISMLSFSLSLAFPPFLFLSYNCLWSVPSEYQCAAVSLETVRGEMRAGYSEGEQERERKKA